jgi:thioredoxin reductase (NADPH)
MARSVQVRTFASMATGIEADSDPPRVDKAKTETPDLHGAFPRLNERQLAKLRRHGEKRPTVEGETLFREGDRDSDFFVILEGTVAIVEGYGYEDRVIGVHGPRRFLGELDIITGQPVFVTAVVCEAGEVLSIPVATLREIVCEDRDLGDLFLRAAITRRSILIELGTGFRIIGSRFSPDTRRLREFATRNRLPHRWIDLEEDSQTEELLRSLSIAPDATPVVIWRGDLVLRNPSNARLAAVLGLHPPSVSNDMVDLVVVGGGPAGLAAAVYGASEGLRTVLFEGIATGGQAGTSTRIENYLGFPTGISGAELTALAEIQARKFGADIMVPAEACALSHAHHEHVVHVTDGTEVRSRAVILAMGVTYRRLDAPGVDRYEGFDVHYAATEVEAQMCIGHPVVVVGGGNSAGQGAVFLARRVGHVHLIVRGDDLSETMSRYLIRRIEESPDIDVRLHTIVRSVHGGAHLEHVRIENLGAGTTDEVEARGLFVFVGAEPRTTWLAEEIKLDQRGFIVTEGRSFLETGQAGVFAVGDVRRGSVKRIASAVGEGSMAVRFVHEHLDRAGAPSR